MNPGQQMAYVNAAPDQFATLESALFPVVAGGAFNLGITASGTGTYLDIPGPSPGALKIESIPFTPGGASLGSATRDPSGSFRLSISALSGLALTANAAYAGDAQHWPALAHTP